MDFAAVMKEKARKLQKRIVLPEGTEERTISAALRLARENIAAEVIVLGKKDAVVQSAKGADVSGVTIIDPETSEWLPEFAAEYYELRKTKGVTEAQAAKDIRHFLRFGAMMVRRGKADAMLAGALSATADVIRAGLTVIGMKSGNKTASSYFLIDTHSPKWGADGLLLFADGGVIPVPTAEQLGDIAAASAHSFQALSGAEPVVAMLSYSTKGSGGDNENVVRVREGLAAAQRKAPGLLIDGELQADAALAPDVTDRKAPGSPVRGKVNVLIFPCLDAGNIGYKLVQRLGGVDAYGPFLQGFAKPINDLSRGCSAEDVFVSACVTLVQAGGV